MRILLDTNVLVAAFLTRGACADLFEHCLAEHEICVSAQILAELRDALGRKLSLPARRAADIARFVERRGLAVEVPDGPAPRRCRDPDDDGILAAALAAGAACIVTGDDDLLVLEEHEGIPILRPADFWRFEAGRPRRPS